MSSYRVVLVIILLLGGALCAAPARAQWLEWAQDLAEPGQPGFDLGSNDDRSSRRAVLGIDGETWVVGRKDDPGETDAFIARFGPDGTRRFLRVFDLGGQDYLSALAPAAEGGVFAIGRIGVALRGQAVLLRFDANGELSWRLDLPDPGGLQTVGQAPVIASDGVGQVYLAYPGNTAWPDALFLMVVARVDDVGTHGELVWQRLIDNPEQLYFEAPGLALSPDGQRLAVSSEGNDASSQRRGLLAVLQTAEGAVDLSELLPVAVRDPMPTPAWSSDGALHQAAALPDGGTVLRWRWQPGGTLVQAAVHGGLSNSRLAGFAVGEDGAAYLGLDLLNTDSVVILRSAADGSLAWQHPVSITGRARVIAMQADELAVDTALEVRDNDYQPLGWSTARLNASGTLLGAGFDIVDAFAGGLIAMHRCNEGVLHLAGADRADIGRIVVMQRQVAQTGFRMRRDQGPATVPAWMSNPVLALQLDAQLNPVLAYDSVGFGRRQGVVRAFDAIGHERWQYSTPDAVHSGEARLAVGGNRVALITGVRQDQPLPHLVEHRLFTSEGDVLPTVSVLPVASWPASLAAGGTDGAHVVANRTEDGQVLLRYVGADGAQRWQRTDTILGEFRLAALGVLPSGDVMLVFTVQRMDGNDSLAMRRYASVDGSLSAQSTLNAVNGYLYVREAVFDDMGAWLAGAAGNRWMVASMRATAGSYWMRVGETDGSSHASHVAVDAASNRIYAAITEYQADVGRAGIVAYTRSTALAQWSGFPEVAPGSSTGGLLLREGHPVLVVNRLAGGSVLQQSPVLAEYAFNGSLVGLTPLPGEGRWSVTSARIGADPDRLFLLADRALPGAPLLPALISVRLDENDQLFANGFE